MRHFHADRLPLVTYLHTTSNIRIDTNASTLELTKHLLLQKWGQREIGTVFTAQYTHH